MRVSNVSTYSTVPAPECPAVSVTLLIDNFQHASHALVCLDNALDIPVNINVCHISSREVRRLVKVNIAAVLTFEPRQDVVP